MISPVRPQNWQGFAHRLPQRQIPFAAGAGAGDTATLGSAAATRDLICLNCYPSPIFWPDPQRIRPFFFGAAATRTVAPVAQFAAHVDKSPEIAFSEHSFVAILAPIKTRTRGKNRCRSRHFSLSGRRPCLWRAACKTQPHAALAGRLPGPLSPTRLTKTWWQGRQSVLWAGQAAAICRARLTASRATDQGAFGPNRRYENHAGAQPSRGFSLRGGKR
jgi:hypothetical protein